MVSPHFQSGAVAVGAEQTVAEPIPQVKKNPHWDVLLILATHYHSSQF